MSPTVPPRAAPPTPRPTRWGRVTPGSSAVWDNRGLSGSGDGPASPFRPGTAPALNGGFPVSWSILFLAGLFEVAWAVGLKYTEGFTRLWPSVGTVAAM